MATQSEPDLEKGLSEIEIKKLSYASYSTTSTLPLDEKNDVEAQFLLPVKAGSKTYRWLRWNFFSAYRRMFTLIFAVNVAVLIGLAASRTLTYSASASAASANLLAAILMRQEHVINLLFVISSALPTSFPLIVRRWAAKIYTYGGVHSGCGVAASCWFVAFTGLATRDCLHQQTLLPVVALSYIILAMLIIIIGFAHPRMRMQFHDYFEMMHRFAGWTTVGLFWALVMLLSNAKAQAQGSNINLGQVLVTTSTFWCLAIITICLVYPWIRLRHREVRVEKLSDHAARLHFDYTRLDRSLGLRLSTNPLVETHAFATIPEPEGKKGFSIVVSNAGDWTREMIRNPAPPRKIWVKGAPVYGVIRVSLVFKRTVLVTTGSGIGPCLSMLNGNRKANARVLWSAQDPLKTYGQGIIDSVRKADAQATIIDTRKTGRPDLVAITYRLYKEYEAEAVVVISNPRVTRKIVYGMETRGVPAYGPIFDS